MRGCSASALYANITEKKNKLIINEETSFKAS